MDSVVHEACLLLHREAEPSVLIPQFLDLRQQRAEEAVHEAQASLALLGQVRVRVVYEGETCTRLDAWSSPQNATCFLVSVKEMQPPVDLVVARPDWVRAGCNAVSMTVKGGGVSQRSNCTCPQKSVPPVAPLLSKTSTTSRVRFIGKWTVVNVRFHTCVATQSW